VIFSTEHGNEPLRPPIPSCGKSQTSKKTKKKKKTTAKKKKMTMMTTQTTATGNERALIYWNDRLKFAGCG